MIDQGKDPKDRLIEDCKPKCGYWKDKLTRCEIKLEKIIKINPTKSCLYPMRDWVTCVEACVQPAIHHALRKSG
jgi:ubiquinol-cytochrome c reductase subunit 6